MTREIGSEFSKTELANGNGIKYPMNGSLVFSGRTAIEVALSEIPKPQKALLPSYCCESMIVPFKKARIPIDFYPVYYDDEIKIDVKIPKDVNILLLCNYFGFNNPMPDLTGFVARGGKIIEDITHSLFSKQSYHKQSHYLIASVRKWEPVNCGGYYANASGQTRILSMQRPPEKFIKNKHDAMKLKKEYLCDLNGEKKERFLTMFQESNSWLMDNYSGLAIDLQSEKYLESVDMEAQKRIRRKNAEFLYNNLTNACFLYKKEDMDCPLFVPILTEGRDEVRKTLIENKIYCPVHWPKPEECESNLYDMELSLVCDQRYNEEDMKRIVYVLEPLLKSNQRRIWSVK